MVAGHLREIKGYYYIVLSYTDHEGKRRTPTKSTGLTVKENKRKAEKMLLEARMAKEEELARCKTSHSLRSSVYNLIKIKAETPSDNLPRYSADYLRVLFLL